MIKLDNTPQRVAKIGRPTKATPEVYDDICLMLERGLRQEEACAYAGISSSTFSAWRKKPEFQERSARVRAARIMGWFNRIENDSQGDWKRFKWLMQQFYPERYGSPDGETSINLTQNNNTLNYNDPQSLEDARRALDEVKAIKDARRSTEDPA
jgi:hypothetical protein